jgi:hypothetical protein
MATESNEKTYTGGCHCGFTRYKVLLDLSEPAASRCNCSICLKASPTTVRLKDATKFTLESPASLAELSDYQFGTKKAHHYFCPKCSVHCYKEGSYEFEGQVAHFQSINLVTLDDGQDVDFRKFKITYWDGKAGNWAAGPKDEPYDGGVL